MSGYVYYITTEHGERVKIGYTRHFPTQRLKELQCGSPFELCIIATQRGTESTERSLHGRFAEFRLHGEWFQLSTELKQHIREVNRREYELAATAGRTPERWCRLFHGLEIGLTPEEADAL